MFYKFQKFSLVTLVCHPKEKIYCFLQLEIFQKFGCHCFQRINLWMNRNYFNDNSYFEFSKISIKQGLQIGNILLQWSVYMTFLGVKLEMNGVRTKVDEEDSASMNTDTFPG